jgi:sigma-B regulation protein RsbU (phosphoserine phosphatase)
LDAEILGLLMATIPDRIYFKDRQSRIVRNNAAHARALGAASPEACVGKSDADFFTAEHAAEARADEERIMRTGEPVIGKTERIITRDGRHGWASTTKLPWRNAAGDIIGTYGLTRDVTEAKQAEEKLVEERNLLRTIIDHLPSRLYVKDTAARYVMNNQAHLRVLGVEAQAATMGRTVLDFFPGERGAQAMADDQQVLGGGASILNQEKSDFGAEGSIHWSLVTKVPLHDTHGRLTGLVGISHDITRRKLAEEEIRRRTAEMEADVRMARQVQEAFLSRPLPVFPPHATAATPALHFAHRYLPTSSLGGDFFDLIAIGPDKCGVLVCDVMGHGVRAGLLTALVRGVVGEVGRHTDDPAAVLAELNRSLMPVVEQTGQPVFATAFYGVIDLKQRRIAYANAGHPPPLIARTGSAAIQRLAPEDPEPATGLLAEFGYSRLECEFAPGDLLLGFTDGITEAADNSGRLFGEDQIRALLTTAPSLEAESVCHALMQSVGAHHGGSTFEDDVCVVAVAFKAGT